MRQGLVVVACVVAAVAGGGGLLPAAAVAREPVHVHWESLLGPLQRPGDSPTSLAECPKLRITCIDDVARRLGARADALGCDHRAIFARNYQRLTEVLRKFVAQPGFFSSRRFLVAEDMLFARLFFDAYDGRHVPEAWRIAFDAWRGGDTYGVQDLLLGINAHVQRDMPYVVAAMGLGRKDDHDRVNEVLDAAYGTIVDEVADAYDPSTAVFASPLTPVDDVFGIELVRAWREGVWRNAEALVAAKTDAERAAVEQRIEGNAAATARMLAIAGPPGYGAIRDAYCRQRLAR
jgi:hypothetical protein